MNCAPVLVIPPAAKLPLIPPDAVSTVIFWPSFRVPAVLATCRVPARVAAPVATTEGEVADDMLMTSVLPLAKFRLPLTLSVPLPDEPGAKVPPLATVTAAVVPLPARVPPLATATLLEDAMLPFTVSVPPVMLVAPV